MKRPPKPQPPKSVLKNINKLGQPKNKKRRIGKRAWGILGGFFMIVGGAVAYPFAPEVGQIILPAGVALFTGRIMANDVDKTGVIK